MQDPWAYKGGGGRAAECECLGGNSGWDVNSDESWTVGLGNHGLCVGVLGCSSCNGAFQWTSGPSGCAVLGTPWAKVK